jgi:hypothetical protein
MFVFGDDVLQQQLLLPDDDGLVMKLLRASYLLMEELECRGFDIANTIHLNYSLQLLLLPLAYNFHWMYHTSSIF